VLGHEQPTFTVAGHHFALVCVEGLSEPTTYEVLLDGEPTGSGGVIRPICDDVPLRVSFGSCRRVAPHHPPYTLRADEDDRGCEWDALRALALAVREGARPPDLFLHLGDQVYADDVDPATMEFIRSRRDTEGEPGKEVADFDEYCELYRNSWTDPDVAPFLASVPSAMIFDDHDVHDDWNTSQVWVERMRRKEWWDRRVVAAFMSYWVHQHIGNLAPGDLDDVPLWPQARAGEDITEALREFAFKADREVEGTRWSFHRDLGNTRIVVMDSRAGRVLTPGKRRMLDDGEWGWIEEMSRGDHDHVIYASTLPVMLGPALHMAEAWNEAVCNGAWGTWFARLGERIREAVDLEHWSAFRESFISLEELMLSVAEGRHGARPASVVVLGGDVHHAYLARGTFEGSDDHAPVWQAVCSPMRNPLSKRERRVIRMGMSRRLAVLARGLARAAGVKPTRLGWEIVSPGAFFDNQVGTLDLDGRDGKIRIEKVDERGLHETYTHALASPTGFDTMRD
jgi:hypothetical protein